MSDGLGVSFELRSILLCLDAIRYLNSPAFDCDCWCIQSQAVYDLYAAGETRDKRRSMIRSINALCDKIENGTRENN